jgi:hypothetical protein
MPECLRKGMSQPACMQHQQLTSSLPSVTKPCITADCNNAVLLWRLEHLMTDSGGRGGHQQAHQQHSFSFHFALRHSTPWGWALSHWMPCVVSDGVADCCAGYTLENVQLDTKYGGHSSLTLVQPELSYSQRLSNEHSCNGRRSAQGHWCALGFTTQTCTAVVTIQQLFVSPCMGRGITQSTSCTIRSAPDSPR